jgi:UDP-N-acetylglucosamine diphosphorylase / glucose-1-phosphate thymidylyltransferase / UDP-N-acetylgalactosamine diphosphorylase / glucosamine-1-phosphate N-acetyltransferase / galactosamine-1-phosphate N-acetyltransferase
MLANTEQLENNMENIAIVAVDFDDKKNERFDPLSLTRCCCHLRAGVFTFHERYCKVFDRLVDIVHNAASLLSFADRPTLFIDSTVVIDRSTAREILTASTDSIFIANNEIIAVFSTDGKLDLGKKTDYIKVEISAVKIDAIWQIIAQNGELIERDFNEFFGGNIPDKFSNDKIALLNPSNIYISPNADIDPFVTLDARNGAIIIDERAHIQSFSTIIGPAAICRDSIILPSSRIREGTTIGPVCRAGGEIEDSVFLSYSNKYHDGFIGHSYIGEWVNLGALTTNSDLKNNYGEIRFATHTGDVSTKMNKLGAFIGDQTKLGIGTLIGGGSNIGAFVNFYGGGTIPRFVRSFSWGSIKEGFTLHELEKAIATAKIVLSRRKVDFTPENESAIREIFRKTVS